uniref:alanine transaminase n=1 Tax=Sphaeramia orbicularis TaxID=375764 RepID=A0A672YT58_9TELE
NSPPHRKWSERKVTIFTPMSDQQETGPTMRRLSQLESVVLWNRARQIKRELKQGVKKPYREVIDISWGDPQGGGIKPLSFVRQVLAACHYPQLLNSDKLPEDVRQRAERLLKECAGRSTGSYTATQGIPYIVKGISEFITRRDGGVPSFPNNIYISSGSQCMSAVKTGVLTPVPCYDKVNMSIRELGGVTIPYYLHEDQGWELQIEELNRALESAKGVCNPVALYVMNPGNPTGSLPQRRSSFSWLMSEFVSYKKVLAEMGPPISETVELASFHSASKGLIGECGLRGGYVELVNVDPAVMEYIYKLFSTDSCASVPGQIALNLMTHPPQPGDPSYSLYNEVIMTITQLIVFEVLNSVPGFSCQPVEGGGFAFPRLHLPLNAIHKAKEAGMQPDEFYCVRLLEESGLLVNPGWNFEQKEGTSHFRMNIMIKEETLEGVLRRLVSFHTKFMKEFS